MEQIGCLAVKSQRKKTEKQANGINGRLTHRCILSPMRTSQQNGVKLSHRALVGNWILGTVVENMIDSASTAGQGCGESVNSTDERFRSTIFLNQLVTMVSENNDAWPNKKLSVPFNLWCYRSMMNDASEVEDIRIDFLHILTSEHLSINALWPLPYPSPSP
ncbi:hypothetical protein X798_00695 [Onchocerca flexuosa]|uniref:Uncharacterized protein n=1 Tax=Onchocerca flexuosa TaxID=387005 RepID=A0A238C484_9BILA|nr:hypothetical protein X798_00695 [Onchocerca flexuosa]